METFVCSFAVPQLIGALAFSCNSTAQLVDMFFLLILAAAVAGVHYMAGNRAQPCVFLRIFRKGKHDLAGKAWSKQHESNNAS